MTDFSEKYKTLSNTELFKIIERKNDYQVLAVEAAQNEINNRELSPADLQNSKSEIENEQKEKDLVLKRKKEQEDKLIQIGTTFFDTINPLQKGIQTPEKLIRLITIIFSGLTIIQFFREFGMINFMFTNSSVEWDFSMVLYFMPLIILPLTTILFWQRKKIGWIILSLFLTYSATSSAGLFLTSLNTDYSTPSIFDDLFPQTIPTDYLFILLFYAGTLWVICKKDIRDIYTVNEKSMFVSIAFSVIATGLFISSYL
jgi:hypothetical protein